MSRGTQEIRRKIGTFSPTGLSPSLAGLSNRLRLTSNFVTSWPSQGGRPTPTTPRPQRLGPITCPRFGLFPFRSPLLRESNFFFFFLGVLRCFSSPTYLLRPTTDLAVLQTKVTGHYSCRVSPFGYLRVKACSQLSAAFRSQPRPSSAPGAKASTTRP